MWYVFASPGKFCPPLEKSADAHDLTTISKLNQDKLAQIGETLHINENFYF
jgi:hypothetical protein